VELIAPLDLMFLLGESREHPMHVAGLQVFEPPEGAGPEYVRDIYQDLVVRDDVSRTFRKHPAELLGGVANLTWAFDRDLDLEYHLRRSALPSPRSGWRTTGSSRSLTARASPYWRWASMAPTS
jgi:diacylglycerol O-acyltransferase